ELAKGAKLRLAVRQGFERATRTIVDANITTLITAVVLYAIGTDQVRGFAIMLILGILMCMFTAIFCARLIFDVAIHRNWVSELKMTQILPKTNVDFLGKRYLAGVFSVLLIGVGIGAVVMRGSEILDIDFTGGTSVTIVSSDLLDADSVRKKLAAGAKDVEPDQTVDITVTNVQMSAYEQNSVWKIVTSLETEEKIKSLITQSLEVESYTMTGVRIAADDADSAGGEGSDTGDCQEEESDDESTAPVDEQQVSYLLTFSHAIATSALLGNFESAAETLTMGTPSIVIDPPAGVLDDDHDEKEWLVTIGLSEGDASELVGQVTTQLRDKPVWISANTIGGKVAGKTQETAIAALVASLFGIVIYIWIRFQKIVFGLAAVVALIHDVLITLGAIAVSAWLAPYLGFLLMDEFRISLPVVAAFLTIIGYSLNDTIVVFDRIREVRGRSPDLSSDMVNTSINQTLSRTILTSFTTLLVVLILYTIGGQGIHGFAYALIIGVVAGTYSSIFVASPSLMLMMDWVTKRAEKKKVSRA
ncbi:MAG TPA: protein translocase subunit SecF, partial [Planctomycetaceae bacterium]|nr:protein translocase subunit SecF [Planctomycetaceae bacterium]